MSDDPVVAAAARAAARELAPQYGTRLLADVEVALHEVGWNQTPQQFVDPVALGSLIVAIAALAYQIYSDRKKPGEKPPKDSLACTIRLERRRYSDLTAAEEKVIEIVSVEVIRLSGEIDGR